MAKRRRRFKGNRWLLAFAVILVTSVSYIMLGSSGKPEPAEESTPAIPLAGVTESPAASASSETAHADSASQPAPGDQLADASGGDSIESPQPPPAEPVYRQNPRGLSLFEQARQSDAKNDLLNARHQYNQALALGLPPTEQRVAQDRLIELADQMLFSSRRVSGDPLVDSYVVQAGDVLAKIARAHHLTPELLARVNELKNKDMIRVGQNLKILKGPFRVEISKSGLEMWVYLQDVLVRHYSVGLGQDSSTPTGRWVIKNKLVNPTYYDPRGGGIVAADDPMNPLGERWLGLTGVEGEAVGQARYGIHGTNDPSSIGKSLSLGCVRLHNADVEWLYDLLVEQDSEVLIRE